MDRLSRPAIIFAIILACIVTDQATKLLAKIYLAPDTLISFAGDLFRLQYAENKGAFLSLGASLPEPWRHLLLTVGVGVFLFTLIGYLLFARSMPRLNLVCLSLVAGGGSSNWIDRVAYDGRVVDFLNVGIGALRTGIFNVADMAITGALMLFVFASFHKTPSRETE